MKGVWLALAFVLCVLPLTAVAGTKQSASINLDEPVVLSGTHLKPGDYRLRWDGTGSDVKVEFLQGRKELVSVPAKLISQHNAESPAVTFSQMADGAKTISQIDLSKLTLQFPETTESVHK